jgi:ribosomal protein S18 acetylase RimI-like enzyme
MDTISNILTIRRATVDDVSAISALINDLMPYLTLDPQGAGAEQFIANMTPSAIERYVTEPIYHYQVGFIGEELAGVVALRGNTHLFHMFVPAALHRQGIGRQLWQAARAQAIAAGNADVITVNASNYAVPMYRNLGFEETAARIEEHGIAYTPMQYEMKR